MIRNLENLIIKIGDVDRRVIFVLIGLAVLIPLLTPVSLPIRETPTTVKFYEGIEEIPKGSKVLVSFDYGKRQIVFHELFYPTNNMKKDLNFLKRQFKGVVGRIPKYSWVYDDKFSQ